MLNRCKLLIMKYDNLKNIADYALKSALNSEKYTIVAEAVQKEFKCPAIDINMLEEILAPFGVFTNGFGDLTWKTFTLNANGVEFTEMGGIVGYEERCQNEEKRNKFDKWLDRFFNIF